MTLSRSLIGVTAVMLALASPAHGEGAKKNWAPPAYRTQAQALADAAMAAHPELLSVTFHGAPPGTRDVYTMFAGSYPDRIGNPDDPDDVDVIKKGITIIDPRWRRTKDAVKKFVVQTPLRDAGGENVGLIVYAFKVDGQPHRTELQYFEAASAMRDALEPEIKTYDGLFGPAK